MTLCFASILKFGVSVRLEYAYPIGTFIKFAKSSMKIFETRAPLNVKISLGYIMALSAVMGLVKHYVGAVGSYYLKWLDLSAKICKAKSNSAPRTKRATPYSSMIHAP